MGVQAHANVIAHAAPAHAVVNALPTPVITHAAPAHVIFNALSATGVIAPGPLSAALGYNSLPVGAALHAGAFPVGAAFHAGAFPTGAALPAGVIPTGPQVLPQRIVKREADAEADADADADADAQFFGLNAFPVGRLATGPASLHLAAAPVAPLAIAAPRVEVVPQCQQKVDRQCRQVPVQTVRQIAVPRCVSVPQCITVPQCIAVPK